MSDQFIGGETIKQELKSILNFTDYSNIPKRLCKNKYLNLDGSYYIYNCNHDLIVKYDELTKESSSNINNRLEVYSKLNNYIDTYYYFLSTPSIINDKLYDKSGNEENYFQGNYNRSKLTNHYGEFYGEDSGEVIFDFNDNDKDNLLVLGSSYTNDINKLIAFQFNKTL